MEYLKHADSRKVAKGWKTFFGGIFAALSLVGRDFGKSFLIISPKSKRVARNRLLEGKGFLLGKIFQFVRLARRLVANIRVRHHLHPNPNWTIRRSRPLVQVSHQYCHLEHFWSLVPKTISIWNGFLYPKSFQNYYAVFMVKITFFQGQNLILVAFFSFPELRIESILRVVFVDPSLIVQFLQYAYFRAWLAEFWIVANRLIVFWLDEESFLKPSDQTLAVGWTMDAFWMASL